MKKIATYGAAIALTMASFAPVMMPTPTYAAEAYTCASAELSDDSTVLVGLEDTTCTIKVAFTDEFVEGTNPFTDPGVWASAEFSGANLLSITNEFTVNGEGNVATLTIDAAGLEKIRNASDEVSVAIKNNNAEHAETFTVTFEVETVQPAITYTIGDGDEAEIAADGTGKITIAEGDESVKVKATFPTEFTSPFYTLNVEFEGADLAAATLGSTGDYAISSATGHDAVVNINADGITKILAADGDVTMTLTNGADESISVILTTEAEEPVVPDEPDYPSWTTEDVKVLDGDAQTWTKNSEEGISIRFDADAEELNGFTVIKKSLYDKWQDPDYIYDEAETKASIWTTWDTTYSGYHKLVEGTDYTIGSGSTIITFSNSFLNSLDAGEYIVEAYWTNLDALTEGYAEATFTIADANTPDTGVMTAEAATAKASNASGVMAMIAAFAMGVFAALRKKFVRE